MDNSFLPIIENSIKENWEYPALSDYHGQTYSYRDFARKIAELHMYYDALKLQKGDKVALCGRNMANWAVVFFGTLSYGAVITSILHDFNAENIYNIVNHSEAKVLFVSEHVWEKLSAENMPQVNTIIRLEEFSVIKSFSPELIDTVTNINHYFDEKYPGSFAKEDVKFHEEKPEELAVLNYTSGTTSHPKGVMLPYRSLWSNTRFAIDKIPFLKPGDGTVCMLPMAHMYGLAFEILLPLSKGCRINFLTRVPSPQVITEAFSRVHPKLVLAVPLIIEKIIRSRVFPELEKQPVKTLLKIPGIRKIVHHNIHSKLTGVFGGNLQQLVIGGAALNREVGHFLSTIGFPYTVGYGLTECGPLVSYEDWADYKEGSCGKIVDRMEIKVDSENPATIPGEMFVRGMNMMLGYYKDEAGTQRVVDTEGWFNTEDLGIIDSAGNIFIKGRSKALILGASGQNIYPEEIESLLNNYPYVGESIIVERQGRLVALVYPDKEKIRLQKISESQINDLFSQHIKDLNKRLPAYSQVSEFNIRQEEFEKTPKQSIRRFIYNE